MFFEDLDFFHDQVILILTFRKSFLSFATFAKMKFLLGRRCLKLLNGNRGLYFATCVGLRAIATYVLMLLIMVMCGTELSAEDTLPSLSLYPIKTILKRKVMRCMVDLSPTAAGLFSIMHRSKCLLTPLISFGIMSFIIYMVLISLRRSGVRRCRVSSCLWTRRKVF